MKYITFLVLSLTISFSSVAFAQLNSQASPINIADMIVWLRGDAGVVGGASVTSWEDQTANGNDADDLFSGGSPSAVVNFSNQQPAVSFTSASSRIGSSSLVAPSWGSELSFALLVKRDPTVRAETLVSYGMVTGDDISLRITAADELELELQDSIVLTSDVVSSIDDGNLHLVYVKADGASSSIYYDGSLVGTGAATPGAFTAGGSLVLASEQDAAGSGFNVSNDFQGEIAEIVMFDTALSSLDEQKLNSYFFWKYGITSGLSSDQISSTGQVFFNTVTSAAYSEKIMTIGRDDDFSVNLSASSSSVPGSITSLAAATGLDDQEFLTISTDDTSSSVSEISTNLTPGGTAAMIDRTWLAQVSGGTSLTADLAFDLSGGAYTGNLATDFYLVRDDNDDPVDGFTTRTQASTFAADVVTFSGETFDADSYLYVTTSGTPEAYNPTVTAQDAEALEGSADTGIFLVDLGAVNNTGSSISVSYSLSGEATEGTDYASTSGSVSIPNGTRTATVVIDASMHMDTVLESDESITLTVTSVSLSGLTFTTDNATLTLVDSEDTDSDGISAATEDAGFNGGDMDGDGVLDSQQKEITSKTNPVLGTSSTALKTTGSCTEINQYDILAESSLQNEENHDYPVGLYDFILSCDNPGDTASIEIIFGELLDSSSWVYRKFDGTSYSDLPASANVQFSEYTYLVGSNAGDTVTKISYNVTDGGVLDEDGLANGVIVDPGGPSIIVNLVSSNTSTRSSSGGSSGRIFNRIKLENGIAEDANILLTFSGLLDADVTPEPSSFQVLDEKGTQYVIDGVQVFKQNVLLTLSAPVKKLIDIFVSYKKGDKRLKSAEGHSVSNIRSFRLANTTDSLAGSLGSGSLVNSDILGNDICSPTFTTNLSIRSSGKKVQKLQRFLKEQGYEISLIDGLYGKQTYAAVSKFQVMHKDFILTPLGKTTPTGNFAPMTRVMANLIRCEKLESKDSLKEEFPFEGTFPGLVQVVDFKKQTSYCPVSEKLITYGARGEDVLRIQSFLSSNLGEKIDIDGIYGKQTRSLISEYQEKYAADILAPLGYSKGTGNWYTSTESHAKKIQSCR